MEKLRFLGDNHGSHYYYKKALVDVESSIQVGDFGIGFCPNSSAKKFDDMLDKIPGNHRFIRGNHDNPFECKLSKHYIEDGTIEGNMMFIGGAGSIDKEDRLKRDKHESIVEKRQITSWWPEEELSYKELSNFIDLYEKTLPSIMVTHECPEEISELIKPTRYQFSSRTRQAFQSMFEIHRPSLWIFGHWHVTADLIWNDTRFVCLNIDEFIDVKI